MGFVRRLTGRLNQGSRRDVERTEHPDFRIGA